MWKSLNPGGYSALKSELQRIIPSRAPTFDKLRRKGSPYRFREWANDREGHFCLRYEFELRDNLRRDVKRVPFTEMCQALLYLRSHGKLDRQQAYPECCPVADSDGSCGFAVLGRIFEALGVARYEGAKGFVLIDDKKADALLR